MRLTDVAHRSGVVGGLTILLLGCSGEPTSAPESAARVAAPAVDTAAIQDVPALRVPLRRVVRPWDTSRVAFVEIVRAEDGYVTFGIKEPTSPRVRATGLRAAVSRATILAGHSLLRGRGAKILYPLINTGAVIVQMDPEAAADLRDHPLIDYAEPRRWGQLDGVPGTASSLRAFSGALTQYSNEILPWGVNMVNAPAAWDSGAAGFGASVLIVDSGHERGHADLPVIPTFHCGGEFGGCDDGFPPHGTHVAGILTARDNSIGVVGVAPLIGAASLYFWGACRNTGPDQCPQTEVARGIDQGIAWSVDVINLSLSYPEDRFTTDLANMVSAALAADIVVVASAGNDQDNTLRFPAAQDGVIGVSGVRNNREFASTSPCPENLLTGLRPRSNWGPHVDLAAPFWALSTVPSSDYGDETGTPPSSGQGPFWCGNSMATPHVAAAAAILRGKYPNMSRGYVATYLFQSADDRDPPGWDDHYGYGILNVAMALAIVLPPPPPPLDVTIFGPDLVQPNVWCTWYVGSVSGGTPPYSYEWSRQGSPAGNGTEVTLYTDISSFTVRLNVTASDGAAGSDEIWVTNTSSAPECIS